MRLRQDLCIALVLAVTGSGLAQPPRGALGGELAAVETAMAEEGLSEEDMAMVRRLISEAGDCQRAGDDDGAALAMARASAILGIA